VKMRSFLEFLACTVFGRMPPLDLVKTALLLLGPQRSGKSTVLQLCESFFRAEQIAHLAPDFWGKAEHLAQLAGRALNTITELQTRKKLKGNVIKQVLSHEPVTVRRLYGNSFSAVLRCTNWWACNELPMLDETHPSLMRRFIVLSMGETLTDDEAAEDFWSVYEAERPGVINLVARSFLDVMDRGHFLPPPDSDALISKMQFGDDVVPMFARVRLEARPGTRLTTDQLRNELRAFALEQGVELGAGNLSGSLKQLAGIMKDQLGAVRKKSNGNPFYVGVALKGTSSSAVKDDDWDESDGGRTVDLGDL
jgi:phage/plasmid-associated DNA primase